MIPAQRTYLLLLLGLAIAPTTAIIWGIPAGIVGTLLFDGIVLALMFVDGWRVKRDRMKWFVGESVKNSKKVSAHASQLE